MDELQTDMITAQKKCYLREIPHSIFDKSIKILAGLSSVPRT